MFDGFINYFKNLQSTGTLHWFIALTLLSVGLIIKYWLPSSTEKQAIETIIEKEIEKETGIDIPLANNQKE